jgi:hypothetical protein
MQYVKLDRQPDVTKFRAEADGIEVWHTHIHKAGTIVPQHAHKFPHLTVLSAGAVRVELDGEVKGQYAAPWAIYIAAGTKHLFTTLADDTVIDCIHNVSRRGHIELAEEHQIVGDS